MFKRVIQFFLFIFYLSASSLLYAQDTRIYSVVIPWSAGGPSDVLFRAIEPSLNARLEKHGIKLIVENIPGAGGQVGLFKIIESQDKLIFGFFSPFFAIVRNIRPERSYNYNSVNYLNFAGFNRMVVISGKYKNVSELCANKKTVTLGSSGIGSMSHLSGYHFAQKYLKCDEILDIPYKATTDAYTDLKAGRIDILSDFDITAENYIAKGYFNSIAEIKDTDLLSWHIFVSNKGNNKDIDIVQEEFELLKRDKKFVDELENKFHIMKFAENRDIDWLREEFRKYGIVVGSLPKQ